MFSRLVIRLLATMERRYDYDTSYMRHIWQVSPRAFLGLMLITLASRHRERVPKDAYFAAKLVGALVEDCGPCTQLVVNMAREAKVADDQIAAVLRRDVVGMSKATAIAYRFATAMTRGTLDEASIREEVVTEWGEKGVIDLTFSCQVGRLFPMLKAGLGYGAECRRVNVGGRSVEVIRQAA